MHLPTSRAGQRGRQAGSWRVAGVLVIAALAFGCASQYEKWADRDAYPVIDEYQKKVADSRPKETPPGVITPKPEGPEMSVPQVAQTGGPVERITLKQALALAFSSSRVFKLQKESLYLSALGYAASLRSYQWKPGGTLSASTSANGSGGSATVISAGADATLTLTRKLLTGGTFSLEGGLHQAGDVENAEDSASSTGKVSFTQPLLEGAGVAAREEFIQLKRGMLNTLRGFETFRQQLVIDTMSRYYGLIRAKQGIDNARARVDTAKFNYERAQALFDKGMWTSAQVLQMEQDKLQAEIGLTDAVEAYNVEIDRFKFELGISSDKNFEVADEGITPEIVNVNLEEAVKTALANRFDIIQARESLGDSERSVAIARNRLLPQLQFTANAGITSDADGHLWDWSIDPNGTASAGLTLQIPIDNKPDRDAYKGAVIRLTQQRRAYDQKEEEVRLSVRQTVRKLRQAEVRIVTQTKSVESAQKWREATQLLFEKGQKSARDIVDVEKALQDAKDALVQAQVDYVMSSIQLRKELGTLVVDESGNWR